MKKHFTYDEKSMTYIPAEGMVMNMSLKKYAAIITFMLTVAFVIGYIFGYMIGVNSVDRSDKEVKIVTEQADPFTQEKLTSYLSDLNVKFPQIVYAQAVLETGEFKSEIFKSNNNLFGMKEAKVRPTTNCGTDRGHALYTTWQASVLDYALYQAAFLSHIHTEDEYYNYLSQFYAEDPTYVTKVKSIVQKNTI